MNQRDRNIIGPPECDNEESLPIGGDIARPFELKTTFETYLQWVVIQDASGTKKCKNTLGAGEAALFPSSRGTTRIVLERWDGRGGFSDDRSSSK